MGAQELGRWGEWLARLYLIGRGYRVLCASWRAGRLGEIDLVVRRGDVLAFVEVKTRRRGGSVPPEAAVSPAKRRRLIRLAEAFLAALPDASPLRSLHPRLDVIAVVRSGRLRWTVRHYAGAFDATRRPRVRPP